VHKERGGGKALLVSVLKKSLPTGRCNVNLKGSYHKTNLGPDKAKENAGGGEEE